MPDMAVNSTLMQLIQTAGLAQHATQQTIHHSPTLSSKGWTALAHVCRVCTEDLLVGTCSRAMRQTPPQMHQHSSSSHRGPQLETAVSFSPLPRSAQQAFQLQRCSAHLRHWRDNLSAAVSDARFPRCAAPPFLGGPSLCCRSFSTQSRLRNSVRENSRAVSPAWQQQHDGGGGHSAQPQLSQSIVSLETLRDAEELLVARRSQFKAEHVALLVARFPDLDLEVANAHIRIGQLLKLTGDALCKTRAALLGPELVGAVIAFARLGAVPPGGVVPLLQELCAQEGAKMAQCSGGDLCSLAWALVRLQGLYGGVLQLAPLELLPERQQQQQQHHQRQLSHGNTPAHAEHSQAQEPAPLVVEDSTIPMTWAALSNALLQGRKLKQATGDDVAKLAWAMAKAQHTDLPLLDAMAQRVTTVCSAVLPMEEQDPSAAGVQLMSRLAHLSLGQRRMALKALQQRKREIRLKEAMALRAARKAALQSSLVERSNKDALLLGRSEDRQHLLLTGSKQAGGLAAATAAATRREAKHVPVGSLIPSPSGIANLAWAFLSLGQRAPSLQAALARAAVVQKADFTPPSLATVLWAYAACGYYDRVMCNTLGRRAALSLKHMPMHEVTQVCWSLATLRHHDPLFTLRLAQVLADQAAPPSTSSSHFASTKGSPKSTRATGGNSHSLPREAAEELPCAVYPPVSESPTPLQAVTLLWALAQVPLTGPPAAAGVEGSGLGPAASRAHTQAASLLCRVLLVPGVIESLIMRDCVRALWGAAVLGILPGEKEDHLSMKGACHSLAAKLLLRLHSCSPQELSEEQLSMLHAAVQVVAGWWQVQRTLAELRKKLQSLGEEGNHSGQMDPQQGDKRRYVEHVDPQHIEPGWAGQDPEESLNPGEVVSALHHGQQHHGLPENPQQQQQHQQQQQVHCQQQDPTQDPAFGVKEDASGIIDISHMPIPAFPHSGLPHSGPPTQQSLLGEEGAELQEVQCLPQPLMEAAQAAALGMAAARVQEHRKPSLWEHEAYQVAEALGLEPMPDATGPFALQSLAEHNMGGIAVSKPIVRAHELAGKGLTGFADAQGLLTALLCEGPAHHSRSMPFLPLGSTLLARHSLQHAGWAVVSLPWYEWATLQNFEDQIAYLASKCIDADVHLP